MEYNFFQTKDFIQEDSFIKWVKYGENDSFWLEFQLNYPEKSQMIEEAIRFIRQVDEVESQKFPNIDQSKVWTIINENIDEQEHFTHEVPSHNIFLNWRILNWVAAAILVIGLGFGIWYPINDKEVSYQDLIATAEKQNILIEKINHSTNPLVVKLEDGSVITLAKNAKLSYPQHFDTQKRQVFLSGEAFFEITKNPNKPFYVYANEVVTKVLGTSFIIKAFENAPRIFVTVKTGRVSVFHQHKISLTDPEEKGLIITPNQQAIFSRKEERLEKTLSENPILIQNLSEIRVQSFEDRPVAEVLKVIEKAYGITIIYDEEVLSHCIITTTLTDESLFNKLDIMCKTIGASYKVVDAQVVIQSNGCQ